MLYLQGSLSFKHFQKTSLDTPLVSYLGTALTFSEVLPGTRAVYPQVQLGGTLTSRQEISSGTSARHPQGHLSFVGYILMLLGDASRALRRCTVSILWCRDYGSVSLIIPPFTFRVVSAADVLANLRMAVSTTCTTFANDTLRFPVVSSSVEYI